MDVSEQNKKQSISFADLVDIVRRNKYQLSSGKNVLELPLYFVLGKTILSSYEEFFEKYNNLLEDNNIDEETRTIVKNLSDGLLKTIKEFLDCNIYSSYNYFSDAMSAIKKILPFITIDIRSFYRMRADVGLTDVKDFYHVPFDKVYLSKSERFSIEGYPILYLGYSKRVCELEISEGSLAKFTLIKPINNVLDLTLGQGEEKKLVPDNELMVLYPLIASCYVVPFYSSLAGKECKPKGVSFREEYIIPQFLTMYIKRECKGNGIIYYSVKDPNLMVNGHNENDMRNVALYTSRKNSVVYDKSLIDKFDIKI